MILNRDVCDENVWVLCAGGSRAGHASTFPIVMKDENVYSSMSWLDSNIWRPWQSLRIMWRQRPPMGTTASPQSSTTSTLSPCSRPGLGSTVARNVIRGHRTHEFSQWRGETPVPKNFKKNVVPGAKTSPTPLLSKEKVRVRGRCAIVTPWLSVCLFMKSHSFSCRSLTDCKLGCTMQQPLNMGRSIPATLAASSLTQPSW